jgi:hypothetical protein
VRSPIPLRSRVLLACSIAAAPLVFDACVGLLYRIAAPDSREWFAYVTFGVALAGGSLSFFLAWPGTPVERCRATIGYAILMGSILVFVGVGEACRYGDCL